MLETMMRTRNLASATDLPRAQPHARVSAGPGFLLEARSEAEVQLMRSVLHLENLGCGTGGSEFSRLRLLGPRAFLS